MDSTILAALLPKAKTALRIAPSSTDFDSEITDILDAGYQDLAITAGIDMTKFYVSAAFDALLLRAILTYCRKEFGKPSDYDQLVASYHEQKAQLQNSSVYNLRLEA